MAFDPISVAMAARRLNGLLPPIPRSALSSSWLGPAASAAATALAETLAAYEAARSAIAETADALAATAAALADAAALRSAGDRLWIAAGLGTEVPGVGDASVCAAREAAAASVARLWADAATEVAEADARCAARLRAIAAAKVAVLAPLLEPVSPEQVALALLRVGGWGSVPAGLLGPLAAVLAGAHIAGWPDAAG